MNLKIVPNLCTNAWEVPLHWILWKLLQQSKRWLKDIFPQAKEIITRKILCPLPQLEIQNKEVITPHSHVKIYSLPIWGELGQLSLIILKMSELGMVGKNLDK
jgi:hypothetical protein